MNERIDQIKERLNATSHGARRVRPNGEVTAGSRKIISNISTVQNQKSGMGMIQTVDRSIAWEQGEKTFYENAANDVEYLLEQVRLLTPNAKAAKPRKTN